ncbi:hypothetical protein CCR80_10600 [Rhodothalassium salexigens]|uniref:MotA/TolQ/ExbB proton channel family protein n=1 Tax=Rhodothalassium salexigens TaxID=1086 RepID=UPI001912987B|nr:MotA/TolQ/ExbB proton channel family protein [Rhodothalassium salexigens]MBK5921478.1 hypothetical protein [Rhodothalassium salexigens]
MPLNSLVSGLWVDLAAFLDRGGWPLTLIVAAAFALWTLIFARLRYFAGPLAADRARALDRWRRLGAHDGWHARQIRRRLISEHQMQLVRNNRLIATLVKVCPLLGLLGTVIGMIEVFEVMAVAGNGNARAMAAGISKATITTMAGMVVALSGLLVSNALARRAQAARRRFIRALDEG